MTDHHRPTVAMGIAVNRQDNYFYYPRPSPPCLRRQQPKKPQPRTTTSVFVGSRSPFSARSRSG